MPPQPLPQPSAPTPVAPHLTVVEEPPVVERPPEQPETVVEDEQGSSVVRTATTRVREFVTPPDIVHKPRPSLKDLLTYGQENTHVPDGGVLRAAAQAWSYIALVQAARGYLRAWLWERASRAGIVLALLVVFFLTPPGYAVLAGLTWIPSELHQLAIHH